MSSSSKRPFFADFTRDEMIANLTSRRDQTAEKVKQLIRDIDDANREHPDWPPLMVDDEEGRLARACKSVGLDLAELERQARAIKRCPICTIRVDRCRCHSAESKKRSNG